MVVFLGLIALVAAALVSVFGVMPNSGSSHVVISDFRIFGQHLVNGSTGLLFLYGIIVGVVGMLGITLLWGATARRLASGGMRRELKETKHQVKGLGLERERLSRELDTERDKNRGSSPNNEGDSNRTVSS
ncbi:MAG TPA: hypothetical protein VMV52_02560 [Candidatus Nanopelagicaceae bacterium]|nr:hypothetical protein [Candidatus Nanopelagicaceae bacterium]